MIAKSFGRPEAIFAPNPSLPKEDGGKLYDYIRPLATIEPTAIQFVLPVDLSVAFDDRKGLQTVLEARNVLLLMAWEHHQIAPIVRALLAAHGAEVETINDVEDWKIDDFDSIYIVTIASAARLQTLTSIMGMKASTGSQVPVHNERCAIGPLRAGFVRSARYLLSDCQQA